MNDKDVPAFIEKMVLEYWYLFPTLEKKEVEHICKSNYESSRLYHQYFTFNNEAS
tara:strand:+ start:3371 stop:3535 length:165 start_codon:yes stop_codon:yes gene_type:complete